MTTIRMTRSLTKGSACIRTQHYLGCTIYCQTGWRHRRSQMAILTETHTAYVAPQSAELGAIWRRRGPPGVSDGVTDGVPGARLQQQGRRNVRAVPHTRLHGSVPSVFLCGSHASPHIHSKGVQRSTQARPGPSDIPHREKWLCRSIKKSLATLHLHGLWIAKG